MLTTIMSTIIWLIFHYIVDLNYYNINSNLGDRYMDWLNIYGLVIMIIIMIPNIVFAMREKNFESKYNNKLIEVIEQIGRFGSMFLMIFNISFLNYGYWFSKAKKVYMILVGVLALAYCLTWVLYFKKATILKLWH